VVAGQNGHAAVLDAANGRVLWWTKTVGSLAGAGTGWLAMGTSDLGQEVSYYAI
jgi:hypothetical protein